MENQPQVIIHIMRHATTNSSMRNPSNNPDIVPEGQAQCVRFAKKFRKNASHITHIYFSPLAYTMSTAFLAFADVVENGVEVIALPELRHGEYVDVVTWKQKYGDRVDDRWLHLRAKNGGKNPEMRDWMKIFRWGDVQQPMVWERREIVLVVHSRVLPPGVDEFYFDGEDKLREIKQKEMAEIRKEQMKYAEKLREMAENERVRLKEIVQRHSRRRGRMVTEKDGTGDQKQAKYHGRTPRISKSNEVGDMQGKGGPASAHTEMRNVVTRLSKASLINADDRSHKSGRKRLREVIVIDDDEEEEKETGSAAKLAKRARPSRRRLR